MADWCINIPSFRPPLTNMVSFIKYDIIKNKK